MHWTKDVSDKNCIVCINAITDAHYNVIGCRCRPFCNFLSLSNEEKEPDRLASMALSSFKKKK